MLRSVFPIVFCGFLALVSVGCGHSSKGPCQEVDWYEIGRQDGAKSKGGAPRRPIKLVCEGSDESLAEALYNNGYDSALAQFCTPQVAFELGRTGKPANLNCSPLMQEDFNKSYRQGQRVAEIEKQKAEVAARLQFLDARLQDKSIEIPRRGLLSGEKIELEQKQKVLSEQLSALRE